MYCVTDEQIDFILSDIRRRGVEMEDLQLNLLDHVCCILERELKETDDFERFYETTIQEFYKKELREIETETIQLLTFKNYYKMKRSMLISGTFSAIAFIFGSFFKIMHWPGAGVLLVSGLTIFSLVFLPLVFLLKTKEGSGQNKILLGLATAAGMLYCLSTMFIIQHWPGARIMWLSTLILSALVLLPVYFFRGIRKPDTKLNTIVTSIIMMGVLGVQFTLTAIRATPSIDGKVLTYLQSEKLLQQMQANTGSNALANDIQNICERMKALVLNDVGLRTIPEDFMARNITIQETGPESSIFAMAEGHALLEKLKVKVNEYNATRVHDATEKIPIAYTILDGNFSRENFCSNLFVLNNIAQLQLFLANAENKVAAK